MKKVTIFFEGQEYSLDKCLSGDCKGCPREHYASCGDLIEDLKKAEVCTA